jgi:hypothetical protein
MGTAGVFPGPPAISFFTSARLFGDSDSQNFRDGMRAPMAKKTTTRNTRKPTKAPAKRPARTARTTRPTAAADASALSVTDGAMKDVIRSAFLRRDS